jgi:hypothetical protein
MSSYRVNSLRDEIRGLVSEELGYSKSSSARSSDFDNQEDAALHRLQQRAMDRRRRQMARAADENTSEEERQKILRDLERDKAKQMEIVKLVEASDVSDAALFAAVDQRIERVLSSKPGSQAALDTAG